MKKTNIFKLSMLGMLLATHGTASASANIVSAGTASNPCTTSNHLDYDSNGNPICKNGVSGAVTSVENLRLAIPFTRKRNADSEEQTAYISSENGLSAGDSFAHGNLWGSANYSEFESTFIAAAYEAESSNFLLGYDVMVGPKSVLGGCNRLRRPLDHDLLQWWRG